jgi:hypothetical protein
VSGYLIVGFSGILFSVAFAGGFILWFLTTCKTPINPQQIILPYLVTIIFFIIHVYEEYVSHIEITLEKFQDFGLVKTSF